MAIVKYGGGIVQMSGSIAGNTFARNRFGNYVRPRTKPVNPNTVAQGVCRSLLAALTAYWSDTCTAAQRIAWATYASAVAMKNRLGETVYMTGFNHFIRFNSVYRRQAGVTVAAGPTILLLPSKDTLFAVTASVATGLSIVFDVSLPWWAIADSYLVVFMGQPQNKTRNFFNGPWKYAGAIDDADTSPQVIAPPFTLVLGQKIWVYGRIATGPTDGRLSEPFVAAATVVA